MKQTNKSDRFRRYLNREAIHTVSVIAREAMDRFEEVGK